MPAVHADFNYLFGPSTLKQGKFPGHDPGAHWMERRAFYELYPFTGPMLGPALRAERLCRGAGQLPGAHGQWAR